MVQDRITLVFTISYLSCCAFIWILSFGFYHSGWECILHCNYYTLYFEGNLSLISVLILIPSAICYILFCFASEERDLFAMGGIGFGLGSWFLGVFGQLLYLIAWWQILFPNISDIPVYLLILYIQLAILGSLLYLRRPKEENQSNTGDLNDAEGEMEEGVGKNLGNCCLFFREAMDT